MTCDERPCNPHFLRISGTPWAQAALEEITKIPLEDLQMLDAIAIEQWPEEEFNPWDLLPPLVRAIQSLLSALPNLAGGLEDMANEVGNIPMGLHPFNHNNAGFVAIGPQGGQRPGRNFRRQPRRGLRIGFEGKPIGEFFYYDPIGYTTGYPEGKVFPWVRMELPGAAQYGETANSETVPVIVGNPSKINSETDPPVTDDTDDEKVKVSSDDLESNYLSDKLADNTGTYNSSDDALVESEIVNAGGIESTRFSVSKTELTSVSNKSLCERWALFRPAASPTESGAPGGLAAWWHLNEGSTTDGTVAIVRKDVGPGGYGFVEILEGAADSPIYKGHDDIWGNQLVGQSGGESGLKTSTHSGTHLVPANNTLTVAFWYYHGGAPTTDGDGFVLACKNSAGDDLWTIEVDDSGSGPEVHAYHGSTRSATDYSDIESAEWSLIVVQFGATGSGLTRVRVIGQDSDDGGWQTQATGAPAWTSTENTDVYVQMTCVNTSSSATVSELQVWSRILTETEIFTGGTSLYNSGSPVCFEPGGGVDSYRVKVTNNDTTPDFLYNKMKDTGAYDSSGDALVQAEEQDDGTDESLRLFVPQSELTKIFTDYTVLTTPPSGGPTDTTCPTPGLVAYWRMDSAANTTEPDQTTSGWDLTDANTNVGSVTNNISSLARELSGATEQLEYDDGTARSWIRPANECLTIIGWVYTSSSSSSNTIVSLLEETTAGATFLEIAISDNGISHHNIYFRYRDGNGDASWNYTHTKTGISDDTISFIACTISDPETTKSRLYWGTDTTAPTQVSGSGTGVDWSTVTANNKGIQFGAGSRATSIDEFAFYNGELTAEQITLYWNLTKGGTPLK